MASNSVSFSPPPPSPPFSHMAASPSLILLPLAAAFLFLTEAAAPPPSSSSPGAGQLNLTDILSKGGQFVSFIRLLQQSHVDEQLDRQLNNSYSGLTVFAPSDNAFAALKPGTLNNLSPQEQIELVLFHVLPRYYSVATFQTASNPLPTQASGATGVFTLNVTTSAAAPQAINVSTGVVATPLGNVLYADFPLAVYPVEEVLLPYELFGPKPPAAAPAPARGGKKRGSSPPPAGSDAGVAEPPRSSSGGGTGTGQSAASASAQGRAAGWWLIAGVGVLGVAAGNML